MSGRSQSMFFRMLMRTVILRRGRAASALMAMVVAATVATTMLTLFTGVQSKLQNEFRNYGANIVVVANDGEALSADSLAKVNSVLVGKNAIAVPFAYVVARTSNNQPVVVSGTDFSSVRELDKWWSVTAWPTQAGGALLGARAAPLVSPSGQSLDLNFHGRKIRLQTSGILRTGAAEDNRVYISLSDFEVWTGVQPSTIEIAVSGPPQEVDATVARLKQTLPEAQVRPVRQVSETEARVLGKTRETLLASCILIIGTAALCVIATLTGWVLDRRRDFAIMKALGASQNFIGTFFAAEAALLGTLGAFAGFLFGIGIAAWIGRANFHAPVAPRLEVFPLIFVGCLVVALSSAIAPISVLRRVQPAMILKGE